MKTRNAWCYNNYLAATADAQTAVYAAKHFGSWGSWATYHYIKKRGISMKLFIQALKLEWGIMPVISNYISTDCIPKGVISFNRRRCDEKP